MGFSFSDVDIPSEWTFSTLKTLSCSLCNEIVRSLVTVKNPGSNTTSICCETCTKTGTKRVPNSPEIDKLLSLITTSCNECPDVAYPLSDAASIKLHVGHKHSPPPPVDLSKIDLVVSPSPTTSVIAKTTEKTVKPKSTKLVKDNKRKREPDTVVKPKDEKKDKKVKKEKKTELSRKQMQKIMNEYLDTRTKKVFKEEEKELTELKKKGKVYSIRQRMCREQDVEHFVERSVYYDFRSDMEDQDETDYEDAKRRVKRFKKAMEKETKVPQEEKDALRECLEYMEPRLEELQDAKDEKDEEEEDDEEEEEDEEEEDGDETETEDEL